MSQHSVMTPSHPMCPLPARVPPAVAASCALYLAAHLHWLWSRPAGTVGGDAECDIPEGVYVLLLAGWHPMLWWACGGGWGTLIGG